MSARTRRRNWIWGLAAAIVIAVGIAAAILIGGFPRGAAAGTTAPPGDASLGESDSPVKVIHPKQDASLQVTVHQLATVEPFFQSDQFAKVSGVVRSVPKGINDPVRAGDLL